MTICFARKREDFLIQQTSNVPRLAGGAEIAGLDISGLEKVE